MGELAVGIVVALIGSVAGVEYARWRGRGDSPPSGHHPPVTNSDDASSQGHTGARPPSEDQPPEGRVDPAPRPHRGGGLGCLLLLVGGAAGIGSALLGEGYGGPWLLILFAPFVTFVVGYVAYGAWRLSR